MELEGVKGKYINAVSLYATVMYFDRYPVGHATKNCVDNLSEIINNSVTQSIRHISLLLINR